MTQTSHPLSGSHAPENAALQSWIWRWCLLVLLLLALLLFNLGNRGLIEPDEGRYTNIAGEMLESGYGWWEPRMSDFAHYDKPPLTYWVTAISLKFLGTNEWAARVPSLLGSLMALAGLGWAAWRLYGNRTARWAVLFCGTLVQFWLLARLLTPDMLLTGFVTLAMGFWAEERHTKARGTWWWGCALCFALGWWTKATAALVPLLGVTAAVLMTRDHSGLRALRPLRLLLFVLALGAPWYLSLMYQYPELKSFFFGRELVGRLVGHVDGRDEPIYFHVACSLVGWIPWWPAALVALVVRRRELGDRWRQRRWQAMPLEAWIVITGLAVWSVISSKLVTYTLTLAPWTALLTARVLVIKCPEAEHSKITRRFLTTALGFAMLSIIAGFLFPHWESRLGNYTSTMREIAGELRQRDAAVIYTDRYRPGLEFYFGEAVYYVTAHSPRQRQTDTGICKTLGEPHFLAPAQLAAHLECRADKELWFIRYQRKPGSTLTAALERFGSQETVRVGDFLLDRVAANTLQDEPSNLLITVE